MTFASIALLATLGLIVGFFAGLLGIGGGAIMVPALTAYFLWQGIHPDSVVHLALATSVSCIIFTALLSIHTHQKHQAIIWSITAKMTPAVLLGSALATFLVIQISSKTIALIFMMLMFAVALQMVFGFKPTTTAAKQITTAELIPAGFTIGFISAMIAIGGGSLTVPYLSWHQINIKKAIATAGSIGLPIAVAGSLVFALQGSQQTNLPAETIGYIYWPATLVIAMGSALTASLGANLTHRLPTGLLKKIFAGLIVLLAIKMFYTFD